MPRRFRRWPSGLTLLLGAVLLVVATRPWWPGRKASQSSIGISSLAGSEFALSAGPCESIRAVDGNTLLVTQHGQQFRVRLLGVIASDDPRADDALAQMTKAAAVAVELDKRRAAADGAWFAYVYTEEQFVNAVVLRAGWGRYDPHPGDSFSHSRRLREAEFAARREKLGIWQDR